MSDNNNLQRLKDTITLSDIIKGSVMLKKNGKEFIGSCPFHTDKTPSFTVNDQCGFYHCFSCGIHGDHLDWIEETQGLDFKDSLKYLEDWNGTNASPKMLSLVSINTDEEDSKWKPLEKIPANPKELFQPDGTALVYNLKRDKWTNLSPTEVYEYKNIDGELIGYVFRCIFSDGSKFTPTIVYARNNDCERRWVMMSFDKPRPLYGAESLINKGSVLILEGEKCVDRMRKVAPTGAIISWPQGTNNISKANWELLSGRDVIVWPDNDEPGQKALYGYKKNGRLIKGLVHLLTEVKVKTIKALPKDESRPKGWDVADFIDDGTSNQEIFEYLDKAGDIYIDDFVKKDTPPMEVTKITTIESKISDSHVMEESLPPFKCLGFDRDTMYFLSGRNRNTPQVISRLSHQLCSLNYLIALAPTTWWEKEYSEYMGKKGFSGKVVVMAADYLIDRCTKLGIFKIENMRGRGAWWDNDRSVVHGGDCLYIDGIKSNLSSIKSKKIYEANSSLNITLENPLENHESSKLIDICNMLQWEQTLNGILLSGWIALAPICGALEWRPHIWITSPSGGGKSWVMDNILRRMLGDIAVIVQGSTSEAGIRQHLQRDARPVIFDEAEGEDARATAAMDNVLTLMRQSSSAGGGSIIKGTANGNAQTFDIKSMFAFSSIGVGIKQTSDASRITVLSLLKENCSEAQDHFKNTLSPMTSETITDDYVQRFHARQFNLIPVIRKNAKIFSELLSSYFKNSRIGEQNGHLLAGHYSLQSSEVITKEAAQGIIDLFKWEEQLELVSERDEVKLMDTINQKITRITYEAEDRYGSVTPRTVERNIGELIAIAYSQSSEGFTLSGEESKDIIPAKSAYSYLERIGIKVKGEYLYIASSHKQVSELLRDTPFSVNWCRILARIDGAEMLQNPIRFSGTRARGVKIPIHQVIDINLSQT